MNTPRMPRRSEATHPEVYQGMPAEHLKFIFLMLAIQSDTGGPPRGALINLLAWLKGLYLRDDDTHRLLREGWEGYYHRTDEALLDEILILCEVTQDRLESISTEKARHALAVVMANRIRWYPEEMPYHPDSEEVAELVSRVCVRLCQNNLLDEDWVRQQGRILAHWCHGFGKPFWVAFSKCKDIETEISIDGILTAYIISGPSNNTLTWG